MSEVKQESRRAETQKERWLKYGANVAVASLVVILLAVVAIWLGQKRQFNARLDTTTAGLYSLKPQTINLIRGNQQPIKIVSLYTRSRPEMVEGMGRGEEEMDYVGPVEDLLEEYSRKGSNISVELVDPVSQTTKVDQLIEEVTRKYGGEVQKYKAVTEEYPAVYEQIAQLASDEMALIRELPLGEVRDRELADTLNLTIVTVNRFPQILRNMKEGIDRRLEQKIPDYKGAAERIEEGMSALSQMVGQIVDEFGQMKEQENVPEAIRGYMAESLPRYEQIKKLADELDQRIKELGELKLDELKQSLQQRDTILVMGESEMRVVPREKVWPAPDDVRAFLPDGKIRPRFAGEQAVTSAILSLNATSKPKVVFVRPGGPPMTNRGFPPFIPSGPLSLVAERLRDYNFEVLEKDLSGMWAMQAQMQGSFAPPEPGDEEIRDAIWVVVNVPMGRQMGGPPTPIGPRVAEHLRNGGSAMVLAEPTAEDLSEALGEWGVTLRTNTIAVHEAVASAAAPSADIIEEAQRVPYIFVLDEYGDHALAKPVRSLSGLLLPLLVVETDPKPEYITSRLIPVPQTLKTWGETDIQGLNQRQAAFDAGVDIAPPLWGGAAVENKDGVRLVVIGSYQFITDDLLLFPDPELARQRIFARRFPGNMELFMNSIFWLAEMETMIAISPTAMEVSRIKPISAGVLNTWRVGVLLAGLPLAVVVMGVVVYLQRRD